ncbi:hypothetical protein ACGFZL_10895 [Streptomyces sp. NPDC048182]|uniref:hypothetical protein n=1 Tax=Streptomyces sp. NPDC048182 TaxID=3365507 RepID=UPI0037178F6E
MSHSAIRVRRRHPRTTLLVVFTALLALIGALTTSATATTGTGSGSTGTAGTFVPVNGRLGSAVLASDSWRPFAVAGQLGIPTTGVAAVSVNISVSGGPEADIYAAPDTADHPSFLAMHYGGSERVGLASNTAIVAVDSSGTMALMTPSANVTVFLDVEGYYTSGTNPAPGGYVPVTPHKVAESWSPPSGGFPPGPLSPGQTFKVTVPDLPKPTSSVVAAITVYAPRPGGNAWLTPYADGAAKPANQIAFNLAFPTVITTIIDVNDQTGAFNLFYGSASSIPVQAEFSVDIVGYFTPAATLGSFTPAAGAIYDSHGATVPAGKTMNIPVAGVSGVPAVGNSLLAAALNFRVTGGASNGALQAGADDQPLPTSNLAVFIAGQRVSALSMVEIGGDGAIMVKNTSTSPITVQVDLEGWYTGTRLPITVGSDGWIYYNDVVGYALNLSGPTTVLQNGTKQSDGTCAFTATASGKDTDPDVYSEVAQYNPGTCQRKLLQGKLVSAEAAAKLDQLETGGTTPVHEPMKLPAGVAKKGVKSETPPNKPYIQAYDKAGYIDPLFIMITSLSVNLTYARGQGAILSNSVSAYAVPYAFKYDGWSRSGLKNTGIGITSSTVTVNPNETFTNTDFEKAMIAIFGPAAWAACGFDTSPAVFYLSPKVVGHASGTYDWSHQNHVKGGCSDLVHFHNWHGYGQRS